MYEVVVGGLGVVAYTRSRKRALRVYREAIRRIRMGAPQAGVIAYKNGNIVGEFDPSVFRYLMS